MQQQCHHFKWHPEKSMESRKPSIQTLLTDVRPYCLGHFSLGRPPCREEPELVDLLTRRSLPLQNIQKNLVPTEIVYPQASGFILFLLPLGWQRPLKHKYYHVTLLLKPSTTSHHSVKKAQNSTQTHSLAISLTRIPTAVVSVHPTSVMDSAFQKHCKHALAFCPLYTTSAICIAPFFPLVPWSNMTFSI